MKPLFFAIVLILVTSAFASGQYKKGSVEDKLIELDKAWTFAELKGDKAAAGKIVADDYLGTTQAGEIQDKAQYLAQLAPNADMVKADDYKVRVFGNTAIMTHRATVAGVRNMQFRSTHIWMKRGKSWVVVAHHGSKIIAADSEQ